jgi:SAM-dependent methyltransferase
MTKDSDINHQKEYWDNLAPDKDFTHPLNLEKIKAIISPEQRILDYGCGYGRLTQHLWEIGYKNVLGIDLSPKMIERGKRLFPKLNLKILKEDTPFPKKSTFDLVLLFSVLTCMTKNKIIQKLMKYLHSMLSPGGYLYISDTLIQNTQRNLKRYEQFYKEFNHYGIFRLTDGGIFRHFSITEIEEFTSGFEQIRIDYLQVRTMNNHPVKGFQYLCRKMA